MKCNFRNQSEPLRQCLSKQWELEAANDRFTQLEKNLDIHKQISHENDLLDDLYSADKQAKVEREQYDMHQKLLDNCNQVEILQKQVAALCAKKLEHQQLIKDEGNLMVNYELNFQIIFYSFNV